jgi:hypothetical protein
MPHTTQSPYVGDERCSGFPFPCSRVKNPRAPRSGGCRSWYCSWEVDRIVSAYPPLSLGDQFRLSFLQGDHPPQAWICDALDKSSKGLRISNVCTSNCHGVGVSSSSHHGNGRARG